MATTIQEFINKYNGKPVDRDGFYGAQCADLATQWTAEAFGIGFLPTPYSGGAKDFWEHFDTIPVLRDNFVRIPNTPDFIPQAGDLMVWNGNYGGGYGHVAITTGKGDLNTFESFDQNWGGMYAHLVLHDYNGVYGVLRHKTLVAKPKPTIYRYATPRYLWLKVDTAITNPVDEPSFRYPYPKNTKLLFGGYYDYNGTRWNIEQIVLDTPSYNNYRAVRSDQTTHIDPTLPVVPGTFGIDVSNYQHGLDLAKTPEVKFVIAKAGWVGATYGGVNGRNEDPTYRTFIDKAKSLGKLTGAYWYFYPTENITQQAEWFADIIKDDLGTLLFVDVEEDAPDLKLKVDQFCNAVRAIINRKVYIYCNTAYKAKYGLDPLWQADYGANNGTVTTSVTAKIHQYTSVGRLSGWSGNLDFNYTSLSNTEWLELAKQTVVTPPPPPVEPPVTPEPTPADSFTVEQVSFFTKLFEFLKQFFIGGN